MKRDYSIFAVLALALVLLLGPTATAVASDLSSSQVSSYKQAKASGKLQEQGNGYLTQGPGADGDLVALMNQINSLRKEKYAAIARKNGVPIEAVEMSAGQKLME